MMILYFVRHGESEANVLHEVSNRGLRHPLTERGRAQAKELAEALRPHTPALIFCSPLLRAMQTAEILSSTLGAPRTATGALREYDCGIIEGRSDDEAWRLHADLFARWMRHEWNERIADGESFLDIQARFVPFVNSLSATYGQTDEQIVLVGHGGLYRCMLPLVLVNVAFEFAQSSPMPYTGIIVAELHPGGLRCREWCGATI
jgi:2,3-bisphosphoglycerate-dependent phosphoglycerate mutase